MTPRAIRISVLTMIGIFAVAAPLAHAGGGMGAGSGTTTCRLVPSAPNQPQTVRIVDPLATDDVKVGAAVLVCDLAATGATLSGPSTQTPPATPNAVTCYALGSADPGKFNATITDAFGTNQTVKLGGIQLLCVPSLVNITP